MSMCIYHGNCADGFGAAWVVRKALGEIDFHAGKYQEPPPDVTGKREVYLNKMIKRFAYIKWTGVVVVALTGIIQWLDIYPAVTNKSGYLLAFAIKMIGAIGLLSITFLLALPNERLKGMQRHRAFGRGLISFVL